MRYAVYAPLVLSLLVGLAARPLSRRLPPATAAVLLTVSALITSAATLCALVVLALLLVARTPLLAALGGWTPAALAEETPVPDTVSAVLAVLLAVAVVRVAAALRRHLGASRAAAALCRSAPGSPGGLVVLDAGYDAFALASSGGRVVVSRALMQDLSDAERRVVLAHERAHLRDHHHLLRSVAALSAALDPLLAPVPAAVRFATERAADEAAVREVGDRTGVARALARTTLRTRLHVPAPAFAAAVMSASASDAVERVSALAVPARRSRRFAVPAAVATAVVLGVLAVGSGLHAVEDGGEVLEASMPTAPAGGAPADQGPHGSWWQDDGGALGSSR